MIVMNMLNPLNITALLVGLVARSSPSSAGGTNNELTNVRTGEVFILD